MHDRFVNFGRRINELVNLIGVASDVLVASDHGAKLLDCGTGINDRPSYVSQMAFIEASKPNKFTSVKVSSVISRW